jgi:hypothetical protein
VSAGKLIIDQQATKGVKMFVTDTAGTPVTVGSHIAFSAGFFTLTGTVISIDDGITEPMLQVQVDNGTVQPVSASKVLFA